MTYGLFFDVVTKKDGRLLVKWWNSHTLGLFELRRSLTNPKYWAVWRQF